MRVRKMLAATVLTGGLTLGMAGNVAAQPVVTGGLVNVTIVDVLSGNQTTLQVPITVAANICDVTVAVLAQDLTDGRADCSNDQQIITVSTQRRR